MEWRGEAWNRGERIHKFAGGPGGGKMKMAILFLTGIALLAAGCVNVDLGQASKDWADVGKSFAESYKDAGTPPAGSTPAGTPQQNP